MSEEKIRRGTVIAVEPNRLVVRVEREEEEDCGGCRSCAMKSLCRGRTDGHLDLPVAIPEGMAKSRGDRVTVAYRETNAAVASLLMFLPALLGLFFGGFAANAVFGAGDGIFLAGALGGLAAGLAVTFVVGRVSTALGPVVRLVGGISDADLDRVGGKYDAPSHFP